MIDKIKFLLLLFPVAFYAMSVGGKIPYFLLYTMGTLLLMPIIHGIIGILTIKAEVYVDDHTVHAGDTVDLSYQIYSRFPLPFPNIQLEDGISATLTGEKPPLERYALNSREAYTKHIKIHCKRRGDYTVGYFKITIGDIFHFFRFNKRIEVPLNLRVYPRVVDIHKVLIQPKMSLGEILINNLLFQDYTEISGLKRYEPGDSIKKIHWKASAKQEETLVKSFEMKGETNLVLFINASLESYREDTHGFLEDLAVETSLSIANYCLRKGIRVSLCYEKGGALVYLEGNHLSDFKKLMEELVTFHPTGTIDFAEQISKYTTGLPSGTTVIFITPEIDKEIGINSIYLKRKGIHGEYILLQNMEASGAEQELNKIRKRLDGEGIKVYGIGRTEDLSMGLGVYYESGS